MIVVPSDTLPEVLLIEPRVHRDDRGLMLETFRSERYAAWGVDLPFVQDNRSVSVRGVLRGLHFQHPGAQGKLVTVLRGEIFDVAVDVRLGSPRFGMHHAARLSGGTAQQIWIPPGFAHGFVVLGDEEADVLYKCTAPYEPRSEHTLLWCDPVLGIDWPGREWLVSVKDGQGLPLEELARRGSLPRHVP